MMCADRFINYTLGIDSIDNGHLEIFKLLDELILLIRGKNFIPAAIKLHVLRTTLDVHIEAERALMVEHDYPYIEQHVVDSTQFVKRFVVMQNHIDAKHCPASEVYDFEEAFVYHVDHSDRQFVNYITSVVA